ncbi:MAG TPA: O-methyltransferase [Solirubrobacteraceae bacterium]|nr:O-methyltransferase [Solirubrobacteraceae bacterium]
MSDARWDAVDAYVEQELIGEDAALSGAAQRSEREGLPPIAVSPAQGRLLYVLALSLGARRVLELGTLGGYSTICLARALPGDGELVTVELSERYAQVAAQSIAEAGLADRVTQRVGPAADVLAALVDERVQPFDLVLIDADKKSTPTYFDLSLQLVRAGATILVDNVVRSGAIADADSQDPGVIGMRLFHELLAEHRDGSPRVSATTIQTVGAKGYDGFTLAYVHPEA